MTTIETIPSAEELDAAFDEIDPEDLTHKVRWCDLDRTMCGLHLPGDGWVDDDDTGPVCPECVAADRDNAAHLAACAVCRARRAELT